MYMEDRSNPVRVCDPVKIAEIEAALGTVTHQQQVKCKQKKLAGQRQTFYH